MEWFVLRGYILFDERVFLLFFNIFKIKEYIFNLVNFSLFIIFC